MKRSLALSLLASLAGSAYATPSIALSPTKSSGAELQPMEESTEMTEKQRIMLEVRRQVGSELQDS